MSSTTDAVAGEAPAAPKSSPHTTPEARARLRKRQRAEMRFRWLGIGATSIGLAFLFALFFSIVSKGWPAFTQTKIELELNIDAGTLGVGDAPDERALAQANYDGVVRNAIRALFPDVSGRRDRRALQAVLSPGAGFELRDAVMADPSLVGRTVEIWLPANDDVDMYVKGTAPQEAGASGQRLSEKQLGWIQSLREQGKVMRKFNTALFANGASRDPELAGIRGAAVGSFYTLIVTLALSFPIGVASAVYLEEFAPKNRWTDVIEVNINNLAAVPSIVFGLLGLAIFINFFGLPRSAPVVGGLVLTLMTLPTIIIAGRASLKAVPPSIREAALGMGASRMQTTFQHVLPLAMPGMLTGTIIGMAQALGESAPLLMIGMVAFIVEIPSGPFDPATVLPVQIYLWADSAERAFEERTSAAIMALLVFLIFMNAVAVLLRKRFERRW